MDHTTKKISRDTMKMFNQKLILRILKEKGSSSKSELSKITDLTLPGVTGILDELESLHLIMNLGELKIKRGRFPTMYKLNKDSFKVIGVTIRSEAIRVGLFNILGDSYHYLEDALPTDTTPESIIEHVATLVQQLLAETGTDFSAVVGVGLGMHGIVDHINGISVYPPHLNWNNVPVKDLLESKIHLPVKVNNDCNSLALAEYWFGNIRDLDSFITLNVDYGVGAGIMINGNLFHGSDFGAGQIGHTTVVNNGLLCSCGNYGCLETVSSEISIVEKVKQALTDGVPSSITDIERNIDHITVNHIYEAVQQNDQLASSTLNSAVHYLGIGISTLVNIFNPDKIIISGGLLRANQDILQPITDVLKKHALKTNINHLEISMSELGSNADVLGAATLWINEIFKGDLPLTSLCE